jgi:phage terminase small subunit
MTPKQIRFVDEYLIDLNATAAARRAGYSGTEEALRVTASRLVTKANVAAAIKTAMQERGERSRATADRVLLELEWMALVDVSEFASITSPEGLPALPSGLRRAVVGWTWTKSGAFVLKFAKESAIGLLGRHHKLFTDVVERKGISNLGERLASARKRMLRTRDSEPALPNPKSSI